MADTDAILRVAILYGIPAASQVMNVLYMRLGDSTPNADILDDIVDWVSSEWGAQWQSFGAATASIIGVDVDVVDFEGHVLENVGGETLSLAGTVVTDPTSAGDAAYIKADTAQPKSRGSKYLPGIAEDNVDAGYLDPTILGELAVMLVKYLTGFVGTTSATSYQMGIPSRTLLTWLPFDGSGTLTDVIAYQRRRKVGVGS